jgi:hypothetical protein
MRRALAACVVLLVVQLSAACSTQSQLAVEGATPYVRCVAAPAPEDRAFKVGARSFTLEDGVLTVAGGAEAVRIAVFSGPGLGPSLTAADRLSVMGSAPDLIVMLGGLGDDAPRATTTLRELAKLPVPVVFVAGGRDRWPLLDAAFDAVDDAERIIHATSLGAIRIGAHTLIPLAGAESGRYAVDSSACGFGQADLNQVESSLGALSQGERRVLLSWHAPGAGLERGVSRTGGGKDVGSFELARFMKRAGVEDSLAAWPAVQAARPGLDGAGRLSRLVVPRLWGPRLQRDDGSRPDPGYALVVVEPVGMRLAP